MVRNKHLIQLLIVPFMALLVLFPTLTSTLHDHEEDAAHRDCKETTTHIHEGHFECSLCFVLLTPNVYTASEEFDLTFFDVIYDRPESFFQTDRISYVLGYKYLRGPPAIS